MMRRGRRFYPAAAPRGPAVPRRRSQRRHTAWSGRAPGGSPEPAPGTHSAVGGQRPPPYSKIASARQTAAGDASAEVDFFVGRRAFSSLNDTRDEFGFARTRAVKYAGRARRRAALPVGLPGRRNVEGLERVVIAGAAESFSAIAPPVLLVETHGGAASNPDPERTMRTSRGARTGSEPLVHADDAGLQPWLKKSANAYLSVPVHFILEPEAEAAHEKRTKTRCA